MKFREDIEVNSGITIRWVGWGDLLDHGRKVGSYFFIQLPIYRLIPDAHSWQWNSEKIPKVWGKLTFLEVLRDGHNESYRLDYWPVYDRPVP